MLRAMMVTAVLAGATQAEAGGELSANTQQFMLPSGLKVLFRRDTRFPVVNAVVGINAGYAETKPGQAQVAHLTEHLWFRMPWGEAEIGDAIKAWGCNFNATTDMNHTKYFNTCPTVAAGPMLDMMSTLLLRDFAGIDGTHVAQERRIIEREYQQRADTPFRLPYYASIEALYPQEHPYHRTALEMSNDGIDALTMDDIDAWLGAWYKPDNAVLALSGDLTEVELLELLRDHLPPEAFHPALTEAHLRPFPRSEVGWVRFDDTEGEFLWYADPSDPTTPLAQGRWPSAQHSTDPSPLPMHHPGQVVGIEAPVENDMVMVTWSLPAATRTNYWSLIRAGYYGSRELYATFENDKGVKDAGCFALPGDVASSMICLANVEDDADRDKVRDALIGSFGSDSLNADQKERLSKSWTDGDGGVFEIDTATTSALADNVAYTLMTASASYDATKRSTSASSGMARIKNYIGAFMTPERAVTIMATPRQDSTLAAGAEGSSAAASAPFHADLPAVTELSAWSMYDDARRAESKGGMDLLTVPVPGLKKIFYTLTFPRFDDGHEGALDAMIHRAHFEPDKKAGKEYQNWRRTPVRVRRSYDRDYTALWNAWNRFPKNAEYIMRFFAPYLVAQPTKPMSKAERTSWDNDRIASWRSSGYWERQWIWQSLTGTSDPLGYMPHHMDAAQALSDEALADYWSRRFSPDGATLVAVGAVNHADIEKAIAEWFWEFTEAERPKRQSDTRHAEPTAWTSGRKVALVTSDAERATVDVRMYCPLARHDGEPWAGKFGRWMVSDRANKALYRSIRQETGIAYTPFAYSWPFQGEHLLTMGATSAPDDVGELVELMRDAVSDLAEAPSATELEAGRRLYFHQQQTRLTSLLGANEVSVAEGARGLDPEEISLHGHMLDAVTSADVSALSASCAGHEVVVVEGSQEGLGVVQAQLGEATWLDWRALHLERIEALYPKRLARETKKVAKD